MVAVTLTMVADCINYGHWKTGVRVQALLFSAVTVGQKFGSGFMGAIIGGLMGASGFTGQKQEIASAIAMVKNIYIWGAVLSCVLIIILMIPYRLEKNYDAMKKEMEEKNMLTQEDE